MPEMFHYFGILTTLYTVMPKLHLFSVSLKPEYSNWKVTSEPWKKVRYCTESPEVLTFSNFQTVLETIIFA